MEEKVLDKKIYPGEKVSFSTGKKLRIIKAKPRNIEILSATDDGNERNELRITIQSNDSFNRYLYKEKGSEISPATPLPKNKQFTVLIPKTASEPVFNLSSSGSTMANLFPFPLKSFIDVENEEPVKMFVFQPKPSGNTSTLRFDGDTSYLNGLSFTPVADDDDSLLFSQEMQQELNIPDGSVEIDSLSDEQCEQIVKTILGPDFEEQLDKGKVETGEGKEFWTVKKGITKGVKVGKKIYLQRHILKDFGFKGKFYLKTAKGRQYVIFKGYNGLRKWYTGTRYSVTNPKVLSLSAAGKLKSGLKGNVVTIFLVGAIDFVDWMLKKDNDKQFEDFCVTLGMDALKVVIGSIVTAGITALVLAKIALIGVTAPVWIVIGGTIVIGVFVGLGIDWLDSKTGASEYMKGKGREAGSFLENAWQENVLEPLGKMYYQLEKSFENMYYRQGIGW